MGTESDTEEVRGFPHSTSNDARIKLGLRPVDGQLSIKLKDPGLGLEDLDHDGHQIEADYEQVVPGIGAVRGHASTSGDWDAAVSTDFPEIGRLHAKVDSQMDWSVGLERNYAPRMGLKPSATYGVTQDGMLFRANVTAGLGHSGFSYGVSNSPGRYAPEHWIHSGQIDLQSPGGHQGMVLNGMYSSQFPKTPLRGSFTYTARGKPGSLEASVDNNQYRFRAKKGRYEIATALAREAEEAGRTAELQMRAGFLTATAKAVGEKARVSVGLDF